MKAPARIVEREGKTADSIASLITGSASRLPGLANVRLSVVRLARPDPTGCNWVARYQELSNRCPGESVRLLRGIVEEAREHFNLTELGEEH